MGTNAARNAGTSAWYTADGKFAAISALDTVMDEWRVPRCEATTCWLLDSSKTASSNSTENVRTSCAERSVVSLVTMEESRPPLR